MLAPLLRGVIGKKRINVLGIFGQSLSSWARNDIAEITSGDRPNLNPKYLSIWDSASQSIKPLVYGPLSGGGNEQQPGNSWLDSAYQSGIGWLWGCFDELASRNRVSASSPWVVFDFTRGGSLFVSTGTWGADGDWRPTTAGGAYQDMLVELRAFKAYLSAKGYCPNWVAAVTDLGISTASDASYTTYNSDFTTFKAYLRRDVIGPSCPLYHLRAPSRPSRTNLTAVRADQASMATADPLHKLVNIDGIALEFTPDAPTDDHPTAGSMEMYGRQIGLNICGISHPLKELSVVGDAIYPLRNWQPASLEAYKAGANPWSDFPHHVPDRCGIADIVALASGNVPTLEKTTLGNGLVRRALVFDGTDDFLTGGGTAPFRNNAGGGIFCAAVKMAAGANRVVYAEESVSLSNPFVLIMSDASGNLCVQNRNDAGTLLNTTSLGVAPFDGNWHFIWVTWNGTNFVGGMDGTTGSSVAGITGTTTLDKVTFGALYNIGSTTFYSPLTLGEAWVAQYNSGALAAYLADKRRYCQHKFGTP